MSNDSAEIIVPTLVHDYVLSNRVFKIAICQTCGTLRPPGTSHCSDCDECIVYFDHHCAWLGRDVGIRNYPFFLLFLINTVLSGAIVFCFSVSCIVIYAKANIDDLMQSEVLLKLLFFGIPGLFGLISLCLLTNMLVYHI